MGMAVTLTTMTVLVTMASRTMGSVKIMMARIDDGVAGLGEKYRDGEDEGSWSGPCGTWSGTVTQSGVGVMPTGLNGGSHYPTHFLMTALHSSFTFGLRELNAS